MSILKLSTTCVVLCLAVFATNVSSKTHDETDVKKPDTFEVKSILPRMLRTLNSNEANGVTVQITSSSSSGSPSTSTASKKKKKKTMKSSSVEIGDGTATSTVVATGSRSASAEASTFAGTAGEKATASASMDGQTQTVKLGRKRKGKGGKQKSKEATSDLSIPVCVGAANFQCCGGRSSSFQSDESGVFCGCIGGAFSKGICFFEVVSKKPLVVKRTMGANGAEVCQCSGRGSKFSRKVLT
eukprot:g3101.t1